MQEVISLVGDMPIAVEGDLRTSATEIYRLAACGRVRVEK